MAFPKNNFSINPALPIFVEMNTNEEHAKPPVRQDDLDRRLAMTYKERYELMMRLFRMGKMMETARLKSRN
jgi:hypothetical protein